MRLRPPSFGARKSRRNWTQALMLALLGVLFAVFTFVMAHAQGADDALKVVRGFYVVEVSPDYAPYSKRLDTLWQAALKRSKELNEPVAGLDFAFYMNGQDSEDDYLKSVQVNLANQDGSRAQINVTFQNGGPQELIYSMVREADAWRVDDVRSTKGEAWLLSDLLREGAATK